ncbi:hypothetical protein PoB_002731700 [Plakobranchus ocellatus]|uniref:Uncharacterized protein n=1 Tax=Plakobranchus ocellatus TaxID=259542 RepID=A0AAV4A1N3_9GAST|nr:hypothetical protein PoB_002731700 [Plakobranchus ocellatus]
MKFDGRKKLRLRAYWTRTWPYVTRPCLARLSGSMIAYIVDQDGAGRSRLPMHIGSGEEVGIFSIRVKHHQFEKKNTCVDDFAGEFSFLNRTTGENPACTTGGSTAVNARADLGEVCTPGTVTVILKSDWSVHYFFSRSGEARPCCTQPGPGPLCM